MLKEHLKNNNIILASGSPRRQQFFKDFEIDFEIRLKEIDEIYPKELKAHEITNFLAELKASSFENEIHENEILITSDTIVWHNNEALGKPKNYDDAFLMLQKLSNATHQVITSVCFKTKDSIETIFEYTDVTFSELKTKEIEFYLTNFKPFDKAGSYGIQDWIGLIGISNINGSYTNVVGLPTEKVYHYLINFNQ